MSKRDDMDFALFADQMIESEVKQIKSKGGVLVHDPVKGITQVEAPNISNIKLDESLKASLLESGFGIKPESKPKTKVEAPKKSINEFTAELMDLIKKAQTLLNEMTTCGNIGVATIEPKANKPIKKKKTNSVLADRVRNKLYASYKQTN